MINTVTIVSLSSGIIGESFVNHEKELGVKRLGNFGFNVKFSRNALKGLDYIKEHPEKRAEDLIAAFRDEETDMILCAIGGDDTYRLLPYLFGNDELKNAITDKVFLGFSDSTVNHLMLHKVGLNTFYGQSFLADICELARDMLPYTEKYFKELLSTGRIERITPSEYWYEERTDFSESALNTDRVVHKDEKGFVSLQGAKRFSGKILGGCIDTFFDLFNNERYSDSVTLCTGYSLFPSPDDWRGKILLLETSEETPSPEKYRRMAEALKATGIFNEVSGVICGKPMNEKYFNEYNSILLEVIDNPLLPVVANINVGHAAPRCIIPFGIDATVDVDAQEILFNY